jgi:hypothetical protein
VAEMPMPIENLPLLCAIRDRKKSRVISVTNILKRLKYHIDVNVIKQNLEHFSLKQKI